MSLNTFYSRELNPKESQWKPGAGAEVTTNFRTPAQNEWLDHFSWLPKQYMPHLQIVNTDTVLQRLRLQRQEVSLIYQVLHRSDIKSIPERSRQVNEKYKTKNYELCSGLFCFVFFSKGNTVKSTAVLLKEGLLNLAAVI